MRRTPTAAVKARCKARRNACKDQRSTLDGRTLACADHIMLLTALPPRTHAATQIGALYRLRWQIALAFKRMKSLLPMDRLPAKDADLAKVWLHANRLVALLAEDTIAQDGGFPPDKRRVRSPSRWRRFDLAVRAIRAAFMPRLSIPNVRPRRNQIRQLHEPPPKRQMFRADQPLC